MTFDAEKMAREHGFDHHSFGTTSPDLETMKARNLARAAYAAGMRRAVEIAKLAVPDNYRTCDCDRCAVTREFASRIEQELSNDKAG